MATAFYVALLFAAAFSANVVAELSAETGSDFIFDLFNNYLWQPPADSAVTPRPLDLLTDLLIEE